jgi:hypothetical protein
VGLRAGLDVFGEEKNLLPLAEIKLHIIQPAANTYYAFPTP